MQRIVTASMKAMRSLPSGSMLKIFIFSLCINALALGLLIGGISTLFASTTFFGEWDWMADIGAHFLGVMLGYFLFPILLPLIITFFDTAIASAIEREEYPSVPAPEPPFWPTLAHDVKFTLKALLLNILVLPLYLVPLINLFIFYLLNGYLLGHEFFRIVAGRHIEWAEARALMRQNRMAIVGCGAAIAFAATIPILNLVAPIWGVALMVHLFHGLNPKYKVVTNASSTAD